MESCLPADHLRGCLQAETTLCLDVLACVQITEMAMGQGCIGQRPSPFGRWPLGRVRGQNVQMEPCWHLHLRAEMPSGPVEPQEDLLALPRSHGVRQLRQGQRQGREGDRGQE
jgi:hypothetical protein